MTRKEFFERISGPLPGEEAHMEFSPMRGKSSELLKKYTGYRESAVAIILFLNQQTLELSTIVTERQVYLGQHSGQISFPGGKKDPTDPDLQYTASRECFEEIGINLPTDSFIRSLTPVFIPVSNFLVNPNLFFMETEPHDFILSPREVAQVHILDLEKLFLPEAITHRSIQLDGNMTLKNIPHFTQADVHIWGATALMLNELKYLLNRP